MAANSEAMTADPAGGAGLPLLHEFFERQVARTPAAPAIEDGDTIWTYLEMEHHANRAARFLMRYGAGRDVLVVLHLPRSRWLVALILGVLKAGAAYLPLDPEMDRESVRDRLGRDPAVRMIVTASAWDTGGGGIGKVWWLDQLLAAIAAEAPSWGGVQTRPSDLAYGIFTSGSTGLPKLVGVEHRNVANIIDYATSEILDGDDLKIVPFIDTIGVDSCVHQIFATLATGGMLLVERDLRTLLESINAGRITSLGTAPAVLARLIHAVGLPPSVRVLVLGGDVIPETLIARIRGIGTVRKALNYYGPTETTLYSSVAWLIDPRVAPAHEVLPRPERLTGRNLGRPVRDTRVYVVDENGAQVPDGIVGEIWIAGAGVARGYLDAPELTAQRFGPDPWGQEPGQRCYRTGDRGRILPDGTIEFIGRLDSQFKLNGFRMEPEEIEAHIASCPGIKAAAVLLRGADGDHPQIVAYVTADPGIDLATIRAYLRPRIPQVMIPSFLVRTARLPLTPSGKLNRAALSKFDSRQRHKLQITPPRNDLERALVPIWQDTLNRQPIGINDDFFELGGDSLTSMQLLVTVERAFAIRLGAGDFDVLGTIAGMAREISRAIDAPSLGAGDAASKTGGVANDNDDEPAIFRRQRMFLASWTGDRRKPDALIVTQNGQGSRPGLFWCFQGHPELAGLAASLGNDQPVHGMRSGHLIMPHTPENIAALALRYATEIDGMSPDGPLLLGGNCQGASIILAVAAALSAQGRAVERVFLVEQTSIEAYDGSVTLIFGRESSFNPYLRMTDPDAVFRDAYPAGFTVDLIDGTHGTFFRPPNVAQLATAILKRMPEPAA